MSSNFDKGMSAAQVKAVATNMERQANEAKKEVDTVLDEMRSISQSWYGQRAADMSQKINEAETAIREFHIQMEAMNQILTEIEHTFQEFDAQGN